MEVTTHPEPTRELDHVLPSDDEDLSEDQIQALLKQAEVSLRDKAASAHQVQSFSASNFKLPKLDAGEIATPYIQTNGEVARVNSAKLLDSQQRDLANQQIRKVEDPVAVRKKQIEATAGDKWFNLPKTDLTPELKRDLQLLKMRNVLDPHRHYKKEDSKDVPEYSQVGTIVEGPTEYYSARIQKKDRKRTFVEEVLAQEKDSGRFKRKYGEIQTQKTSGKKAHYKAMKAKRKPGGIGKG
ncbi:Fcf2 pre-rRNA processing-domain-containing protein [Phyllosticta capitalensis]|uniref:Fcf2 pre-rRNA processing-domain-containing protein n=1 Tax=Phyllosticta capitalensis TaxID=121624 RepID=UPI003130041C